MTVVVTEAGKIPEKPKPLGSVAPVIDAMKSVQTESDRWKLAEALVTLIPTGEAGFKEIVDRAKSEGHIELFSANTLRLYRDTAKRWAKDKRVPLVSFSAHREAMAVQGDITAARKLLQQQVTALGSPSKVTLSEVRKAVRIANGKKPSAAKPSTTSANSPTMTLAKVVEDLEAGGKQLAAAIPQSGDLDAIHAGLSKVLDHVERLRAKKAKAKAAAKAPAKKAPTASKANGAAKRAPAKGGAGDLRGL